MTALRLAHLQVEAAEKCLPEAVHIARGGTGLGGPQPHRWGSPLLRQVLDLQSDQHALDQGKFTIVVEPWGAVREPGVDPAPCLGLGPAVVGGVGDRGLRSGLRLGEPEFRAVLGRLAVDAMHPRWLRQAHHAVGAHPADQLDRQVAQDPGQAGWVSPVPISTTARP
ncbi:hypothetical protein GCM10009612_72550 [Streptomyces beijiangensis]